VLRRIPKGRLLQLAAAEHLVEDPQDYTPIYPFGWGEEAEPSGEPEAKKPKRMADTKPAGRAGAAEPKYARCMPPERLRIVHSLFKQLFKEPSRKRAEIIFASMSKSTWNRYESVMQIYREYLSEKGKSAMWPTDEDDDSDFLLWMGGRESLSGNTVEMYFSVYKNLQTIVGFDSDVSQNRQKRIRTLIQGIKNTKPIPEPIEDRPRIGMGVLKTLRKAVADSNWNPGLKMAFWTCCLAAFFGSFRISELLTSQIRRFDSSSELSWSDVKLGSDETVSIRIKRPKTKKGPEVVHLFKFRIKEFCPVRAFEKFRMWQKAEKLFDRNGSVFAFRSGRALSSQMFSSLLAGIVKANGLGKITGQSFRTGIPTIFETAPELAADSHIKSWGRWRSKAYQKYMRADKEQKKWLFTKIEEEILKNLSV